MKRLPIFAVALLASIVASPVCAVAGVVDIGQNTTFPYVISKPGSYRLTSDLIVSSTTTDAIDIQAPNVSLDLNGFTIRGPVTCTGQVPNLTCSASGLSQEGINAGNEPNITVRNGTVRGFAGFGVALGGDGGRVEDVSVFENTFVGILVEFGIVQNSVARRNAGDGIEGSFDIIKSCNSTGNAGRGFFLIQADTLSDSQASLNGNYGVVGDGASLVSTSQVWGNVQGDLFNVRTTGNNACSFGLC
jgi:hypothetical protein